MVNLLYLSFVRFSHYFGIHVHCLAAGSITEDKAVEILHSYITTSTVAVTCIYMYGAYEFVQQRLTALTEL